MVRLDNTRSGITRACLYDPDVHEVHAAFAEHWGFTPLPSRPSHPQEQGIQEGAGAYVKNALEGRRFESLEAHNEFLARWNRTSPSCASTVRHGSLFRQNSAAYLGL